MKRLNSIEALRGVAALLVVGYHLQDIFVARTQVIPFKGIFGAGDRGVDLFFVLSGFVISTTHRRDIDRPGNVLLYLYKRACRLFPAVWIVTAFALGTYMLNLPGLGKLGKLELHSIIASFLLLPQTDVALVNVTWTLKYELFFYLMFALLILDRKIGAAAFAGWVLAYSASYNHIFQLDRMIAAFYLQPIVWEFAIGVACTWLLTWSGWNRVAQTRLIPTILVTVGSSLFLSAILYEGVTSSHAFTPNRVYIYGLTAAIVICGLTLLEQRHEVQVPKSITRLGATSYSLYLTHYSILTLCAVVITRAGISPPSQLTLFGCSMLAVLIGAAFHVFIDQPIQRWLQLFRPRGGLLTTPHRLGPLGSQVTAAPPAPEL